MLLRRAASSTRLEPLTAATIAVTIICALSIAQRVSRVREHQLLAESTSSRLVANSEQYALTGYSTGPHSHRRTLVVFTDFGCQYCKQLEAVLQSLQLDSSLALRVVYRHYPLRGITFDAAVAAECAHRQQRFDRMKNVLFAHAPALADQTWMQYAMQSDVPDSIAFAACLADPSVVDRIEVDVKAGESLLLRGTPAVLAGSRLFDGLPTEQMLRGALRSLTN